MAMLQAILLTIAATGGGDKVLLDFYSDTCGPCQQMRGAIDQLAARGYAIRKVNVTREPGLAAQFGVGPIPCFVMVADGREVDRVVGMTSLGRLEQMFAVAGSKGSGIRDSGLAVTAPAVPSSSPQSPIPNPQPRAADELQTRLVAASVRLRVKDAQGQSCGSGTIIDARKGRALILTCGHLFRDSQGKGPIEVDLFGPTPAEALPGELIHYDLERDLALVSITPPGPVTAAPLAPHGFQVTKGAKVVHVGCNNGAAPTARMGQVTSINRFAGPPNVEVSGVPVQGRSGGGLFTADGELIGVCNAAIPSDNEGLYAALGAIQSELDARQLAFVYDHAPASAVADGRPVAAGPPTMPKTMAPPSDLLRWTEAPVQPVSTPAASESSPSAASASNMTSKERAVWEEIQRRKGEGAEVICIIRPRTGAAGKSDVLIVEQPSAAFLDKVATPSSAADAPSSSPSARPRPEGLRPASDWQPRWLQAGYQGE